MWIPQLAVPLGAGLLGLMAVSKLLRRLGDWGESADEGAP